MAKKKIDDFSRVLLVEGHSDLLFLAEILEELGLDKDVFIKEFNGKSTLLDQLEVFLTPENLQKSIAIIVDADANEASTCQQVADRLKKITHIEFQNGQWNSSKPRLGFLVLPGNGDPGEIETLVWKAITSDATQQSLVNCVDTFLHCMKSAGKSPQSPDKARISAFLAVLNDEDPRLGPGARSNAFDFQRPEYDRLKEFLSGLRDLPE